MTKRYEYKYAIEGVELSKIIDVIRFHPLGFTEAYPQRKINNFYLDTTNLDFFYQNMDGIAKRRKFRYRWYGDLQTTSSAQLEIKHKENELGWKETIKLDPSHLHQSALLDSHFQTQGLSQTALSAKLYNSYDRYYFQSADGIFRITLDYDQKFGRPYLHGEPYRIEGSDQNIILELKFDETHITRIDEISHYLPFLRTKNSKYSNGITAVYFE